MINAARTGIFCAIMAGMCFLASGIMGRALSLDPLVSFAMMAGVLTPMVMLASGMLSRWALYSPFTNSLQGSPALSSMTSGVITASCSLVVVGLMLVLSRNEIFPSVDISGLDAYVLPGALVILGAYVALSVIGGELYSLIFHRALRD